MLVGKQTFLGVGRPSSFLQRNGYPYALWNRDERPTVTMRNTYSHWPFVLAVEAGGPPRRPGCAAYGAGALCTLHAPHLKSSAPPGQ